MKLEVCVPFSPFQVGSTETNLLVGFTSVAGMVWAQFCFYQVRQLQIHPRMFAWLPPREGILVVGLFVIAEVCMAFKSCLGLACPTWCNSQGLRSQELKCVLVFITALSVRLVWVGAEGAEGNASVGRPCPETAPSHVQFLGSHSCAAGPIGNTVLQVHVGF